MSRGCKGTCAKYKAKKKRAGSWYGFGFKRCQLCEIFVDVKGLFCPCCGHRLRTHPRNKLYKAKLRGEVLS